MACDTRCCGDKEVKACPVCGNAVPASLGVKPRKYCCARCQYVAKYKPRQSGPSACGDCGISISQPLGKGRRRQFCDKCRLNRRGEPKKRAFQCESCGGPFESIHARRFCSKACRYGDSSKGTKTQCKSCSVSFIRRKKGQLYCSVECRRRHNYRRPPKIYVCLCCQKPFKKKIYPSGNYSCQKKYCSRDCAFEARRRKLPAAQRPLEVAKRIVRWFEQWGDDVYPIVSKCSKCGIATVVSQKGQDPQRPCCECSKPPRLCEGCGCDLPRSRRLCQECAAARKKDANKRERRKARLNGTRAPSLRKRCRKFGVTFTPIPRKKVFDRDRWKCQICGVKLLPKFAKIVGTTTPHPRCPTIDHIVPLSFGPSSPGHVWDNVQACCWQCNCERAAMPLDSFVALKATRLD